MRRERVPAVYIMSSGFRGTIYVGVTSDLLGRVWRHRNVSFRGFTDRYGCKRLAWFEAGGNMAGAIAREKQLKNWLRDWKLALIEAENPTWRDLAEDFGFDPLLKTPGEGPAHVRHAGLDPASTFTSTEPAEKKVDPGSSPG